MTLEQRAQAIADVCLTTWRGGKRRQRIYYLALEMLAEAEANAYTQAMATSHRGEEESPL